jgi:dolichol-phosphate mannosyltransferase
MSINGLKIAAILPCYKSKSLVGDVLNQMGDEIDFVVCVDDCCPIGTGAFIEKEFSDAHVKVLFLEKNQGVGGATLRGMEYACQLGADVLVKVDSDGQMDPRLIPDLVAPIVAGEADYAKGNRFFDPAFVSAMPAARLVGNAGLSFLTKASSGYWDTFDPTNGFVSIHAHVFQLLDRGKLASRYFFESDLLFRLGLIRARVSELPMWSVYGEEESNLSAFKAFFQFLMNNAKNYVKRIFYNYFLRNFSIASMLLVFGIFLTLLGSYIGIYFMIENHGLEAGTSPGKVMISAFPVFVGIQMILAFISVDIASVPRETLWPRVRIPKKMR